MFDMLKIKKVEIWDFECKYIGVWKAGKRWCSLKKAWVKKKECETCEIYDNLLSKTFSKT